MPIKWPPIARKRPPGNDAPARRKRQTWRLSLAGCSRRGPRAANQDQMFWTGDERTGVALIAVADGMGGHAGGEEASRLAIGCVEALAEDLPAAESPEAVRRLLVRPYAEAITEINVQAEFNPGWSDMGTTLSAVAVTDQGFVTASVGDTRVYHLRKGELVQVTVDHNALEEAVRNSAVKPGTSEATQLARMLTRLLGAGAVPKVDVFPEEGVTELRDGDMVLVCSDGVHGAVGDEAIKQILERSPSLQSAVNYLCDHAIENGGEDNATAVGLVVGLWKQRPGALPKPYEGNDIVKQPERWLKLLVTTLAVLAIGLVVATVLAVRFLGGNSAPIYGFPTNINSGPLPAVSSAPVKEPGTGSGGRGGAAYVRKWPCKGDLPNGGKCKYPLPKGTPTCPKCGRKPIWKS